MFSVEYDPGTDGLPLCAKTSCTAACEPWQRCNESGQCVNVSCVDRGSACPKNGAPACCTYDDPFRELSCQDSTSDPGTTSCCVALGDGCRFEDDCCQPYHCLESIGGLHTCR